MHVMRYVFLFLFSLVICFRSPVVAQFVEDFSDPGVEWDQWRVFSGDGKAQIDFSPSETGVRLTVDATEDHRNVWWAVFQRNVEAALDLKALSKPGVELRIEARVRTPHAPRRINLSIPTSRTTDYHTNLMEFDIGRPNAWHRVAFTTRGFEAFPGDRIVVQLAMIDWGTRVYDLEIAELRVDVVRPGEAKPDLGPPVPYHPPIPDLNSLTTVVEANRTTAIDLAYPQIDHSDWHTYVGNAWQPSIGVGPSRIGLLGWDFSGIDPERIAGPAVLELSTLAVSSKGERIYDMGVLRVVEILKADSDWGESVTAEALLKERPWDSVINPQMIIDWPIEPAPGTSNQFVISVPVLKRIVSGESQGIALLALGGLEVAFHARGGDAPELRPKLYLNLEP